MPFPEYQDIEDPLLCEIFSNGGKVRASDTYKPLADYFSLTDAERKMTRDEVHHDGRDELHWNNMVQWARRKLNDRGYLVPERKLGFQRVGHSPAPADRGTISLDSMQLSAIGGSQ